MRLTLTVRTPLDPVEAALGDMLAEFPGDVAMILAALRSPDLVRGEVAAVTIMRVVWGIPFCCAADVISWLRQNVTG